MKIIIAGATGFIGQALVKHWLAAGHQLTAIGRSASKIQQILGVNVKALAWDNLSLDGISAADVIINLAGAGISDKRWTAHYRQEILLSRTKPTAQLAQLCAQLGDRAPALFNASAIGVYGLQNSLPDQLPPAYDENTVINYQQTPDFLAEVARAWEMAAKPAEDAGVRVVYLRFGVVLANHGGALPRIVLPFKFGLGGVIGTGQQPFSWIALTDLISAIDFLLTHPDVKGAINMVAPNCVTQKQLAAALGKVLHRPTIIPTPAFALKLALGEMAEELLLKGQHVAPKRLLELGFKFQCPDIQTALTNMHKFYI